MVTFLVSLMALILGYVLYGSFVERVFGPDDRPTPAVEKADGVDFMVLPSWKIFMIQFLNIAGTGPIFGAIMGAMFGPVAYLWIVLGCIFAGATHDYLSGMLSLRHGGINQPEIIGNYLGKSTRQVMLFFAGFLLIMVGAVFVFSPAKILGDMWEPAVVSESLGRYTFWIIIIFVYYLIATLMPIDKIIGKIYPLFAFSLLFMAGALLVALLVKWPGIPELWDGVPGEVLTADSVFPCLFITIACGAISGFHATQSPLMARCMKSERMGRPIFYGAMITEGIVALIWATVAMFFFYDQPQAGYLVTEGGSLTGADGTVSPVLDAPSIVNLISRDWLGAFGSILALLGVVAAPITSGDTALRSARLIIADFIHLEQRSIRKRLYICIPLFAAVMALLIWQMSDASGFKKIWSWFGWSNQTLSVFMLWALTVYLVRQRKAFAITLVPAIFMTVVCTTYLFTQQMFRLDGQWVWLTAGLALVVATAWFFLWYRKYQQSSIK